MVKLDRNKSINYDLTTLIVVSSFLILQLTNDVECKDKGDDIIMTKGKLIVRGGKGKGKFYL